MAEPLSISGMAAGGTRSDGKPPACAMLIANVSKRHNVGNLLRSCVALGVHRIVLCGPAKAFSCFGAQGTERYAQTEHFARLKDAVADLKGRGFTICGIEITPDAKPVHTHPFGGPTAFLAGNEGSGLCDAHKALCDHFVYIPQHGAGGVSGTASLNVATAAAIVLHHFATWAGYAELPRDAGGLDKFALTEPRRAGAGPASAQAAAVHAAREAARAADADEAAEVVGVAGALFADEDGAEDGEDCDGGDVRAGTCAAAAGAGAPPVHSLV